MSTNSGAEESCSEGGGAEMGEGEKKSQSRSERNGRGGDETQRAVPKGEKLDTSDSGRKKMAI